MTSQEINLAIAETQGWKQVHDDPDFEPCWVCPKTHRKISIAAVEKPYPSYDKSLDELHKVEESLTDEEWETYSFILCNLVGGFTPKTFREAIHAPASAKAEAYLKTKKKWRE